MATAPTSSPTFSLRDAQKAIFVRIICSANSATGADSAGSLSTPLSFCDDWKVLVFDNITKQIISPLLTVSELRTCGVTLALSIESPRDVLSDVVSCHLLSSSPLSARLLTADAVEGRYREISAAFMTPLPRTTLESIAEGVVKGGGASRITRVSEVLSSLLALSPSLFASLPSPAPSHLLSSSTAIPTSFAAYASPSASEEDVTAYARHVVSTVLSLASTSGSVPVLVASRGGPAEMIARLAEQAIRDHLGAPSHVLFTAAHVSGVAGGPIEGIVANVLKGKHPNAIATGHGNRPLCVLLDRAVDLAAPLAHANTYEALVDDTIGPITSNRVVIPDHTVSAGAGAAEESGGQNWFMDWAYGGKAAGRTTGISGRTVTLDHDSDSFWARHSSDLFPTAIDAHERELQAVREREDQIRKQAGPSDVAALSPGAEITDTVIPEDSSALISAIDSLPQLMKRKKTLELHSTLLHAVMDRVAARVIPHFHDAEAPSLFGSHVGICTDRAIALEKCGNGKEGTFEDRLRIATIYLLTACPPNGAPTTPAFLKEQVDTLVDALASSLKAGDAAGAEAGVSGGVSTRVTAQTHCANAVLNYIKQLRCTPSVLSPAAPHLCAGAMSGSAGRGEERGGLASGLFATLHQTTTSLLSKAVNRLTQGEQRLPVTRIVSAICDMKPGSASAYNVENYLVLDPRAPSSARGENTVGGYAAAVQASAGTHVSSGAVQSQFRSAFVLMVGGASLNEHADLQQWAATTAGSSGHTSIPPPPRTIVYGGTEIVHPSGFLQQLYELGKPYVSTPAK